LADDLERFMTAQPIQARPASLIQRMLRQVRQHPLATAIGFALVLALVTGMTGLWYGYVTAKRQYVTATRVRDDADTTVYVMSRSSADLRRQHGDMQGAMEILAQCLPRADQIDHRGWEWFYLEGLCRPGRSGGQPGRAGERQLDRDHAKGVGMFEFSQSGN